jgi:hypothetical protein
LISGWDELKSNDELSEDLAQQELHPSDEAAEVVAGGGENSVGGVTLTMPEVVAAHSVFGFEMADDRLDGGPAAQLAFDLGCHAPFLAGDEDPELVIGRRVVAAVSLVGEDILSRWARLLLENPLHCACANAKLPADFEDPVTVGLQF